MLMRRPVKGFTLIEMMVGLVVLGLLLVLAAPSFFTWVQNTQIRTAAEAVLNGLQVARADAVRRNTISRFQLVSSLDSSCALSTSGPNWIVSLDSAAGACDSTNYADAAVPAAPRVVQTRPASDGSRNAVIAASQSTVNFNGLGRVTPVPASDITIDVTNPVGGTCAADGGPMACLRIIVSPTGQIRMCNPNPGLPAGDPRRC